MMSLPNPDGTKMKTRAPRNRTLTCGITEITSFSSDFLQLHNPTSLSDITNSIINQDVNEASKFLPGAFVDLLILDPPYNLTKNYNGNVFRAQEASEYQAWFEGMICKMLRLLKPTATVYVCSDWQTSSLIFPVLSRHLNVRNRITWEREKGRGAKTNWKNNTEDIWFCTVGENYYFDVEAVKLKRRVIAPYRELNGEPKDWEATEAGNYRLTHPSNIWSDITIPFWSMPENTDHPTQKPEKLIAKLVLASSPAGGFILDPFLGSGTTAVVAKKLMRRFCGIELNQEYCCWAAKRLRIADTDATIQGYSQGVFWERNSLVDQKSQKAASAPEDQSGGLFNE
jgi:site-specific DNA-methyltransferase (adenine-specific)